MLNNVSEALVVVLFLPAFMNIVLPLGMLAGWLVWRAVRPFRDRGSRIEQVKLSAQDLAAR